jgi:hypothetical protein
VADFLEVLFFVALLFFEVPEEPLLAPFLVALFFALARFVLGFGGIFAPDRRASLNPIAIACLGFLTFLWLRPDSS